MFWGCISYFGVVDGNINSVSTNLYFRFITKMILAKSFSTDQFTFDPINRCPLSRLNEPIVIFLDTGRRLKPESKSRRLVDLIE
jgi:hypothetical protein